MWYSFRQNNSGGSFDYSESVGISVTVYVEANSVEDANFRAEDIGLYFDGAGDCSCCGDRWYSVDEYAMVDAAEVPVPDAPWIIDGKASWSAMKWMKGYEAFVHPMERPFYGAYKTVEEVNKPTYGKENGYGFRVWPSTCSSVFAVNADGWDKSGNQFAPANGKSNFSKVKQIADGIYVESNNSYWAFWFKSRAKAFKFAKKIREHQKANQFDPMAFLD
jgi:hypothetical protein